MRRHVLPVHPAMRSSVIRLLSLSLLVAAGGLSAQVVQERVDLGVVRRIRDEGVNRSQIPLLADHLTNVIGPRLTGSTGMRRANEWMAQQFTAWGLVNVAVQPWGVLGFSSRQYAIIRPMGAPQASVARDSVTYEPLPAIMLSQEQYFQMYRNVSRGMPVRLELNVQNRWLTEDLQAYN